MKLKNKIKSLLDKLKQFDLKNSSIKVKLPFYLLVFVLTTLILLWLVEVVFFENIYTFVKQDSLTRAGNRIVEEVDKKHADKLIEKISREDDVCVPMNLAIQSTQASIIVTATPRSRWMILCCGFMMRRFITESM